MSSKQPTKRPVGRPRTTAPRKNIVKVGYSDAEFADLEKLAKGTPIPEFIRARSLA